MRKPGMILGLCLALYPLPGAAADHSLDSHWLKDFKSGCWIFNSQPQSDEAVAWDGPRCDYDEEANGTGTVTWFKYNAWTIAEKGELRNGKMTGEWIRRSSDGASEVSYWAEGVRQQNDYADQGGDSSGDSGSSYTPTYNPDAYLETLKRQNRENCERAAKGANIICNPE